MLGTVMKGDVSPDLASGQRVFHAYEDDSFRLGQESITENFYLHQNKVHSWLKTGVASLTPADFTWLENNTPEVLVIGTGRRTTFPSHEVLDYLSSLKVGYECMDSRSAARTFNLLVGEGRIIAVAMFLAHVRD